MSFQRIFEAARRMNAPLVVTDPAGREPMVVMTLDAYEQITDGGPSRAARKHQPEALKDEPRQEPMGEPEPVSIPMMGLEEVAIEVMQSQEKAQASEISLEDRFFMEAE